MNTATRSVIASWADLAPDEDPPLVVLEPLGEFLDEHGLGDGPIECERIGDGHSFETFKLRRGTLEVVLRRPPRPPWDPGVHDIHRERRVLEAFADSPVPAPRLLAFCEDAGVIGAPFAIQEYIDGVVLSAPDDLPAPLREASQCHQLGIGLIDALAELHRFDYGAHGLGDLGRPEGFLERRISRSLTAFERIATRPIPELEEAAELLRESLPAEGEPALIHGDYRLGNVMFGRDAPARLTAILDWETATLGDPLTDLGYTISTYPVPGDSEGILLSLHSVALADGFPGREELVRRYAERSGRPVDDLTWYQAYSMWRVSIQLEGLYSRVVDGRSDDPWHRQFERGVPELAGRALSLLREYTTEGY
jgi:aminoglycoside phosphotransferase (APT) family kinase protein